MFCKYIRGGQHKAALNWLKINFKQSSKVILLYVYWVISIIIMFYKVFERSSVDSDDD